MQKKFWIIVNQGRSFREEAKACFILHASLLSHYNLKGYSAISKEAGFDVTAPLSTVLLYDLYLDMVAI
ncbi:MAG: hypothetical protein ACI934_001116 [Pseudohongiellaceae bacterium]|jgi:hypothetical protein|tara:strand:+ start:96 stop:302 length:207 start_codon:yes stop_codon:yes gene_type:complete